MILSNQNSLFNSVSYRVDQAVVDAGDEWDGFVDVKAVLLTHGHFDHIYGLNRLVEMNPDVVVYTNEAGKEALLNAKKICRITTRCLSFSTFRITFKLYATARGYHMETD